MNFTEKVPLPEICIGCKEDCGECENALDRWELDPISELLTLKQSKIKAINKLIEEIVSIDIEIDRLEKMKE